MIKNSSPKLQSAPLTLHYRCFNESETPLDILTRSGESLAISVVTKPYIFDETSAHLLQCLLSPNQVFQAKTWSLPNPNQVFFVPRLNQTKSKTFPTVYYRTWTREKIWNLNKNKASPYPWFPRMVTASKLFGWFSCLKLNQSTTLLHHKIENWT